MKRLSEKYRVNDKAWGPYTISTTIPTSAANWIATAKDAIWPQRPEYYYRKLQPALKKKGYCIRSLRRGSAQHLAHLNTSPETLRLMTRHTTDKGLYAYLDDGKFAKWETDKTSNLGDQLWSTK